MRERSNPRRAIGIKIATLARQMRQRFDERVEQMGVTRAKWILIATVANNPGTTQREIAAKLEVSDVTAGRMIDRVCADGLLERRENPQDRRAYSIGLTPAADPLLERIAKAAAIYEAELFAGISDGELATMAAVLDRISLNIANGRRAPGDRRPVQKTALANPGAIGAP